MSATVPASQAGYHHTVSATTDKARRHTVLFAAGTGLWTLALLALLVLRALGVEGIGRWPWVCILGIGLGITGILYARFSWRAR